MIKVINLSNGEITKVWNTELNESGQLVKNDGKPVGKRYLNSYTFLTLNEDGTLTLAEGYEVLKGRAPKHAAPAATEPEPTEPQPASEPAPVEPIEPAVEPMPAPEPTPTFNTNGLEGALGAVFAPVFSGVAEQIKRDIRAEVAEEMAALKAQARIHITKLEVTSSRCTATIDGVFCKDYANILKLVERRKPVYMYGPAGSGKSYAARQVADSLGLDYYETSQAMFAHDLKGYANAAGNYVETSFYKAFCHGGLFFLDEVDASAPEAVVVLNNAIANKRFDFPAIGLVEAHPDFRVMAAGNTRMTGATLAYAARQIQDSSFKNRFFFLPFSYDERLEEQFAEGDMSIVEFAHDLRKAARETGIQQLCSYRQILDLAQLQDCGTDEFIIRGSVLQEKEADEVFALYSRLDHTENRWAKAMYKAYEIIKAEELW